MKFFVLCTALFASFATHAVAQDAKPADAKPLVSKTGFQLRADSTGQTKKVGDDPAKQSQIFNLRTARMIMSGDVADNVSYTLRLDVKNALFGSDAVGTDTSIAALDRAYVEHRPVEGLALRFGRLPMVALSIEADYSSMDRYYESYIAEYVGYKVSPITTGIDVSYTVAGQTFSLDVFNGVQEGTGAQKGTQKGENLSTALAWRGNLAGGIVKPIVSYDRFSRVRSGEGTKDRDDKATYTATGLGSQFSVAGADLDLEYDTFTKPKFTSHTWDAAGVATEVKNLETKITGVIAQAAYNIQPVRVRPFVKVSQDSQKTDGKETYKAKRNNVGVEYRPSSRPFRYHAVVVNKNDTEPKGGKDVTTKTTQYIVGVAAKL